MSNKSGISSQVISLPKGGGALQGIGEKFGVDLHTGTGNFTVPIALPPGRGGFQPELSLVYSSGNGNGPFGLGWDLSVPGVGRKTSDGVPLYEDSKDTFILSGAEDLVPVPGAPGATRYRPRTEGLFARIEHHRADSDDFWGVKSKDGLVSTYGTPGAVGDDPAVVADPDDRSKVFAWRLTLTTDPFGNRIEYLYERDAVQDDGSHLWDQVYLSQVRYVDHGDPANPDFLVTVRFVYDDRPDPFSDYRAGFELRTVRRCARIEVATHADAATPVRAYHLTYLDQRTLPPERLPPNGVSLLSQVRVEGHDGPNSEFLPPLEFGYTSFEPHERRYQPLTSVNNHVPERSLAHPEYELVDLFGNGLSDVIQMNGVTRYWRNLGGGVFDIPRTMEEAPAGVSLDNPGVQMADLNGDGRADLLVTDGVRGGYYPLTFDGGWDHRSFVDYERVPSINLEAPDVKLVDLDGDGVVDALRTGPSFELYRNDPEKGWTGLELRSRNDPERFPNVNFDDPRVKLGDMTGDGLQDIVLIHNGRVDYWPYLGYGRWGRRVTIHNSPTFEDAKFFSSVGYDPERVLLGDVDGDGLADLVYVGSGYITVCINQSGNGFSDPITVHGTPAFSDADAVRLADMLGTGTSGVLWTYDFGIHRDSTYKFLDLTGGVKPYLLNEMDNHMGAVTKVGYAASTRFYREDERNSETRWKTTLPFPVQVVSRVEVIDYFSEGKLTTEYKYHHGYWDGAEREFRGFGMVEQFDTETLDDYNGSGLHGDDLDFAGFEDRPQHFSPPTLTKTWFHPGPVGNEFRDWQEADYGDEFWPGDPQALPRPEAVEGFLDRLPRRIERDAIRSLRGRVLRTELYELDGTSRQDRPHTVTEFLHGVASLLVGEPWPEEPEEWQTQIFFPHALAERVTRWERGTEPMTRFGFTEDYDEYGQPRKHVQIACPRGWINMDTSTSEHYLTTCSETTFASRDDDEKYIVDRAATMTSYEIEIDQEMTVSQLKEAISDGSAIRRTIGQALNFYDGAAFTGLPSGEIGEHGALMRTETLVLDEAILQEAYGGEVPPYLAPDGSPAWTPEYPQEFQDSLPINSPSDPTRPGLTITPMGYGFAGGGQASPFERGYFVAAERRGYDFHDGSGRRGLLTATRDPLGREAAITYDEPYRLLPTEVTDPAGLTTEALHDYRVLQPREVTDPNGNRQTFGFTPLGLPARITVLGEDGKGDTEEEPSTRFEYDFLAFESSAHEDREPVFMRTIRRVHHANDADVPSEDRDETIDTVEYSDGFGRLLQTRTQAEDIGFNDAVFGDGVGLPADQSLPVGDAVGQRVASDDVPRVVVSGWQTYDNKGRVVEKYEPFFSFGREYAPPGDEQFGHKATMVFDPRGEVIRTVNPDGSEQRVIYGIPLDLVDPERFTPTPWEAYIYDENDAAGRTHPDDAAAYADHWNTPSSVVIDVLGRAVEAVKRNGPDPDTDRFVTRSSYDIRGNPLTVTDALQRPAFRYVYDLASNPLRTESIDAGDRRTVLDAAGNQVEYRDGKGALTLHAYDASNRSTRLWARDGAGESLTLREHIVYGDGPDSGLDQAEAAAANLLGKPHKHYDEAGLLTLDAYDFKGNLLQKTRRAIADAAILSVFDSPPPGFLVRAFRVNWRPPDDTTPEAHEDSLLDTTTYQTTFSYDALNRIKTMLYPEDVSGRRKELRPSYNRAGTLEHIGLDGETFVEHIAYNAKRQRTLIALGNGVMTRYAYDPKTFRLLRLRSESYAEVGDHTYQPIGAPVQDFAYEHDLVGNILEVHDRTSGNGVPNTPLGTDALDRVFTYDALYRLRSATGRECDIPPARPPWADRPRCADITRARDYIQTYRYDPVGNLEQLRHVADGSGFTRTCTSAPGSNRLTAISIGNGIAKTFAYVYDASGNLLQENAARHFEWDHSDRMKAFRTQPDSAPPSVHAHYLYDPAGQRIKKLVKKDGRVEITVYVDGVFEHHRLVQGATTRGNNTLHVMDDETRIAMVRVGDPFPDDTTPDIRYHLGDHLGSSNVVIGATGDLINREEYTPYGETSFGSFARKRYRFTGKERDEESKLYYHGARYYAPWLARWMSTDPLGPVEDENLYLYALANPMNFTDSSGTQSQSAAEELKVNQTAQQDLSLGERVEQFRENAKNNIAGLPNEIGLSLGYRDYFTSEEWDLLKEVLERKDLSLVEFIEERSIGFEERKSLVKQAVEGRKNKKTAFYLAADVYLRESEYRTIHAAARQAQQNRQAIEAGRAQAYRQFAQGQYRYGLSHTAILGAALSETLQAFGVDEGKAESAGRLASSAVGLVGGGRGRGGGSGGGGRAGGGTNQPSNAGWTRVSRWMSPAEARIWKGRSSMPQPLPNYVGPPRFDVSKLGTPQAGGTGPVRVDFDVPSGALKSKRGDWFSIFNEGRSIPIRDVRVNPP